MNGEWQDLEPLLGVLACPGCQEPSLAISAAGRSVELTCGGCAQRYPVIDGIPVLLSSESREQLGRDESVWDRVARQQAPDDGLIRARLARHHFVRVMETEAARFAALLPADGWLVDLGAGWTWPWKSVRHPRVLAVDVSLDSLRLARVWHGRDSTRSNIFYLCANASALPLAPASVHGVWSAQMLQHLRPSALNSALAGIRRALVAGGVLVIFWVNWSLPLRILGRFFPNRVERKRDGASYYRRVTGWELVGILEPHFGTPVRIRYNELLFQPDLRVTHDLPIAWLDRSLAAVPGLNAALARQVVATVTAPPASRQAGPSPTT